MNIVTLKNCAGVYQIKNIVNDHIYIGSSYNIRSRIQRHLNDLRKNNHYNNHLQHAWNKYGENNFDVIVLEICSKGNTYLIEQKYIDLLNPQYNLRKSAIGGNGSFNLGRKLSNEHKMAISKAMIGRVFSKEHKAKIGAKHKGKKYSQATRDKISKARKGTPSFWKGKHLSKEAKNKLSLARKGKSLPQWIKDKMSLGRIGVKPTQETRKKLSAARKEWWRKHKEQK